MTFKELRKRKFEKAKDLAKVIGVEESREIKWETGASAPRLSLIPTIAAALDCTVEELLNCFNKEA